MASEWGVLEVSASQFHFQNSPLPPLWGGCYQNLKNALIFAVDNTLWFGSSGSEVPIRYFGKLNAHMHFVYRRRVEPTALPFSSVKTHPYFQKVCSSTMQDFFHFTRSWKIVVEFLPLLCRIPVNISVFRNMYLGKSQRFLNGPLPRDPNRPKLRFFGKCPKNNGNRNLQWPNHQWLVNHVYRTGEVIGVLLVL
jgi:hypothetical protein